MQQYLVQFDGFLVYVNETRSQTNPRFSSKWNMSPCPIFNKRNGSKGRSEFTSSPLSWVGSSWSRFPNISTKLSADFYLAEFWRCWSWSLSPCCRGVPPWRLAVSYASGTSYLIRMRVVEELWQVARRYSTWLYLYNCIKVIMKGCLMSILNVIIWVFDYIWLCSWLYEMMDPWGQSLVFPPAAERLHQPMPSQDLVEGRLFVDHVPWHMRWTHARVPGKMHETVLSVL